MRQQEFVRIFGGVIVLLVILIGVAAFIQVLANSPLWSEKGAAWVQAVGSIAAIVGAYSIAANTHRREQHENDRLNLEKEVRSIKVVVAIIEAPRALTDSLITAIMAREYETVSTTMSSDFLDCRQRINSIPLLDMPDEMITTKLIGIVSLLDIAIRLLKENEKRGPMHSTDNFRLLMAGGYLRVLKSIQNQIDATTEYCASAVTHRDFHLNALRH